MPLTLAQLTDLQGLVSGMQGHSSGSAAILPLNARHELFFGVIIGDGRLPFGSLGAAAWGSVGEKYRQRWMSPSNSHLL